MRFNPRLPGGRRPLEREINVYVETFQSTPSGGKATCGNCRKRRASSSFNPRLPGGRRRNAAAIPLSEQTFQSTPSGGKATSRISALFARRVFQSTPSGGKATARSGVMTQIGDVSIHAFRGEGDPMKAATLPSHACFNPRLPGGRRHRAVEHRNIAACFNPRLPGGRRPIVICNVSTAALFQSTPSGGKATKST